MSTARTVAFFLGGLFLCASGAIAVTLTSNDPLLELAIWPVLVIGGACHGLVEIQKQMRNVDAG
jgi:hypothetical protein